MTTNHTALRRGGKRKPPVDPYIDAVEIGSQISVTRNHAWKLLADGVFGPPIDVATAGSTKSALRIRQSQLDAWLESRTAAARPEAS